MKKTAQFPSMMKCLFVLVHGGLWARKQIQPSAVSEGQSEVLRVLEGMVKVNACPFVVKSDKNDLKVGSGAELSILRMSTDVAPAGCGYSGDGRGNGQWELERAHWSDRGLSRMLADRVASQYTCFQPELLYFFP